MSISAVLLPEFDQEMANTRRTLERIPEDKLEWAPHPKSFTLGRLSGHLAELVGWAATTLEKESLNLSMADYKPLVATTRQQVLDVFDKNVKSARAALAGASDEDLMRPWTLSVNSQPMFTMPRAAVLRGMCFNHLIHHRGQMTVYLRMTGVPVPALYGPSADEGQMGATA